MDLVVGVDVATAEVRAVAADAGGRVHAESRQSLPSPSSPRPGRAEQDAGAWWPAVVSALSDLTERLGDPRGSVVAVSVCATSGTVVALDAGGEPIGPALMYSDQRAERQAAAAQEAGAERWATLGLRVQPTFGLPKWAWLVGHLDAGTRIARLEHASDVVVGHLIGPPAPTDWSHALKSGFDPLRGEWAMEAMEALGIPARLLPEVRPPATVAGAVTGEAAAATGLPQGCQVRLGMTDACAAQLAAGAGTPGDFVSVLGSTLVLKGASKELVSDAAGAVYSHRHPDGWWLPGGASNTGARALMEGFPDRDLSELDALAERRGPATAVTYPLVGRGERFPFAAPDAEGFVLGQPADEVERYRAILEGVAFVERLGYEGLAALGAPPVASMAVTGGGSRSAVWNRIRATVLGTPLVAMPSATTALGACMLAAAGTLHPDIETATASMAPAGDRFEPAADERDALQRNYERFREAVSQRGWLTSPA